MRNALIKWLKKIFSDIHSALIAIIVLGLISGTGIIYRFYKNLWFSIKSTILSPTPLWATIILVFVVLVYIYLKTKKTDSSSAPNYKIEYFPIENLKWKTKIYDDEHFEVERISICKEHDLPLIYENIVYKKIKKYRDTSHIS